MKTGVLSLSASAEAGQRRHLLGAALVAVVLGLHLPAPAAIRTWTGGGGANTYWSNSANWDTGVPQNGDSLIFPANLAKTCTNDLSGRTFADIVISGLGSGWVLRGNSITLTSSLNDSHSGGVVTTVSLNLATVSNLSVNVENPVITLTLDGVVSGGADLTKTGAGTLVLAGSSANTYSGVTGVYQGSLVLTKSSMTFPPLPRIAVPGALSVGNGSGTDTVRLDYPSQIAPTAPVTLSTSGLLDLNGNNQTIGSLTLYGGTISTGTGMLTLGGNVTVPVPTAQAFINGNLNLGSATRTFTVANPHPAWDLVINANIIGGPASPAVALRKLGSGQILLGGNNSFTGEVVLDEGEISVFSNTALGGTADGTTVNSNACLVLDNGVNSGEERLILNSTCTAGALKAHGGADASAGNIELRIPVFIMVYANSDLTLSGQMFGAGGFTKIGPGTLTLYGRTMGGNTYSGVTRVHEGSLVLDKWYPPTLPPTLPPANPARIAVPGELVVGGGAGLDTVRLLFQDQIGASAPLTLTPSGMLDLNGKNQGFGPLTVIGGVITNTGTGTLSLYGDVTTSNGVAGTTFPDPQIYSAVSLGDTARRFDVASAAVATYFNVWGEVRSGGIIKDGLGVMTLAASNTYAGLTRINQGGIFAPNTCALGVPANGTTVASGATLLVRDVNLPEPLTLSGSGGWQQGALALWDGAGTSTNITLAADAVIGCYGAGVTSVISGAISGPGGFTKIGPASLALSGSLANIYGGTTRVNEGTLILSKSIGSATVPGPLIVGDGVGGADADVVRIINTFQIGNLSPVTVSGSGLLEWIGVSGEDIGSLAGSGHVELRNNEIDTGFNNQSTLFSGVISGSGGGLRKQGAGTFTLTGANTYSGETYVLAGTLLVNGSQPFSPVEVSSSGTLGGVGTVGPIISSGRVAPGTSPGCLTSGNQTFTASGSFKVELTGGTPCSGYDQMIVRGTNNLANARLNINLVLTTPVAVGQEFTIIDNDGADAITGIFAGYPQGSTLSQNGFKVAISYVGGSGNDVVLTLVDVPGASAGSAVTSGNGNHAIDPTSATISPSSSPTRPARQ